MGITQTTSAIMIFLTGLLPASCHKQPPQQAATTPAVLAAGATNTVNSSNRNLGEISLTNRNETCLQLATGESCTLTPKLLDKHNVQITLAIESKNDYGETHGLAVTQVVGQSGKPLEVAVGDLNLTFTPRVSQE
jgi:hypothetical protein